MSDYAITVLQNTGTLVSYTILVHMYSGSRKGGIHYVLIRELFMS